jgi:hypothetical protein
MRAGIIGDWAFDPKKVEELAAFFENAHPFPYVVIDNFFSAEAADRIDRRFPAPNGTLPEWQSQVVYARVCVIDKVRMFKRSPPTSATLTLSLARSLVFTVPLLPCSCCLPLSGVARLR